MIKGISVAILLTLTGALGAASGEPTGACVAVQSPSSFDYLVLASIADSQRPIAMATYRPQYRAPGDTPDTP